MDIKAEVTLKRNRITEIDAEIEKLREERRQCIITAKKLQAALEHVEGILGTKLSAVDDLKEIAANMQ